MTLSEQQQEPPTKKSKKTLMAFRTEHAERFGLRIAARDPDDAVHVTSCVCRFCEAFGREDSSNNSNGNSGQEQQQEDPASERRTRRKTQRTKFFKTFRTDLYTQHLLKEHPCKWAAYQQLRSESDKQNFFGGASCDLTFDIKASIVETIITGLLFDPDSVGGAASLTRALNVFEPSSSGKSGYVTRIKTPKRFSLLVGVVATGASFRHATRILETVADETGLACFEDCDNVEASNYVRVACAVTLQQLSDVLGSLTGFSLALDSLTEHRASYLDVRVRFAVQGVLYNFHLLTLPLHTHHNERMVFDVLVEFLDALYAPWRDILVGVAVDSADTMAARIRGLATLLEYEATTGRKLLRVWSGFSQLDRIMAQVCQAPLGGTFCSTMTALIGYLRRQPTLLKQMQTTPPKAADTTGTSGLLSIEQSCSWLTRNIIELQTHFETTRPPCAPMKSWWVLLFTVHSFVREASAVIARLQGSTTSSVSEEHAAIHRLVSTYCRMTKMVGPLSEAELASIDRSCHEVCGQFVLSHADAFAHIERDLDVWVVQALAQLDAEEVRLLGISVAKLFVQGASSVYEIVAAAAGDPDSASSEYYDEPPSSAALPAELVKMDMRAFNELLSEHTPRLSKRLSATKIHKIAQDFAALRRAYTNEEISIIAFDKSADPASSYNDSWAVIGEHFPDLRSFCGDLASTFPCASIASSARGRKGEESAELSVIIGRERDAFQQRLTNFAVEGVLQCKQYAQLVRLADSLK